MLPNLIIIGAAKAGTTSLHGYLGAHPEVWMAAPADTVEKEMRFFWRADWRERRAWYESHFETDLAVRGEATPAYSAYPFHPHVVERMHALIPDARLIYLVRDPVDRVVSHWAQRRADGDITPFARYMEDYRRPENPIVCPSRYWTQVQQYLRHYAPEQLLVVDQHDLRHHREATLARIFAFIGVDPGFRSATFTAEANTRADKVGPRAVTARLYDRVLWPASRLIGPRARDAIRAPARRLLYRQIDETPELSDAMRARLGAMFAPEVAALREFTGQPFASWSL